jgi:putative colanic acid biosynthesis UDP-glucose lipid carrier transferase
MAFLRLLRSKGLNYKKFIIVGNGQVSEDVALQMTKYPEFGFRLMGVFSDEHSDYLRDRKHGYYKDCYAFLKNENINEVYCTLSLKEKPKIQELIKFCELNLIRFTLVPDLEGIYGHKVNINFFESLPIITLRKEPLQIVTNRIIKRTFDIIFSLCVLILIFPILLIIIIPLILIESPGPIFYKQNRAGLNGTTFKIWKFRTMNVTESDTEFKQAEKGDSRITKIGNILRKTSLDEMPQFINILIGNMSVVGPRPHVAQLNEQYRLLVDKYMIRLLVKPGLTGHAQISGFRGETKTNDQMEGRIKSDIWYLENWTFTLDVRIIFQTVINIVKGEENAA